MLKFIKEDGYNQVPSGGKRKMGIYLCSCGNKKRICISNVKRKKALSCGCISKEQIRKLGMKKGKDKKSYKHGMFGTRFYHLYHSIIQRTKYNPSEKLCRFYGNRGIKNEWKCFEDFYNDMYKTYLKHVDKHGVDQTTIDRKNPNGNYCKENCQWATRLEQGKNRRNNVLVTINGKTAHISEWSRRLKISSHLVRKFYLK